MKGLFAKYEEIPQDWKVTKIGDISDNSAGGTPSRLNYLYWENGTVPWISSGEIKNKLVLTSREKITKLGLKKSAAKIFSKGSILLAITGQGKTRGMTGLLGINSSTNQSVVGIKTHDGVSNYYLWYYLQNQYNKLRGISQGSNQGGLNLKLINNYKIFLPSLHEQQKIASILSGVDALIELTQQIVEKTERLKKGLMQNLLTRGIGHTKFKKVKWLFGKEIEIPEGWSSCQLKDTSMLSAGGTPSTFVKEFWNNGTIPWISSSEVKNNRIISSDKKITKFGLENSAAKLFPKGTVLVAITGFGMTRGRSAILEINATTNQSVVGIQSKKETLDEKFLWYLLQNQYWIIRNFAQGSQQPGLNLDILKKFQICIPNSMSEQQKIASILSGVDAYIQKNQQYKEKLERLKKGLMQKLLTGKIRVPLS